jgi:hypothetical protein
LPLIDVYRSGGVDTEDDNETWQRLDLEPGTGLPAKWINIGLTMSTCKYGAFHRWGIPKMDQNGWFVMENPSING